MNAFMVGLILLQSVIAGVVAGDRSAGPDWPTGVVLYEDGSWQQYDGWTLIANGCLEIAPCALGAGEPAPIWDAYNALGIYENEGPQIEWTCTPHACKEVNW